MPKANHVPTMWGIRPPFCTPSAPDAARDAFLAELGPMLPDGAASGVVLPGPRALTPAERGVLTFVEKGLSNKVIAQAIGISPATVKAHLHAVYTKLGVKNRTGAVYALRRSAGEGGVSA